MPRQKKYITRDEMRALFNAANIDERWKNGELRATKERKRHVLVENLPHNCTYCTHTHEGVFTDQAGTLETRAHWYQRIDGSIGASGKLDPHMLYLDGVEYHEKPSRPRGALTPKQNPVARFFKTKWRRWRRRWRELGRRLGGN